MKYRPTHRRSTRTRTRALALTAAALATAGLAAPPAQAYDNDPHVTLQGGGGCRQFLYQATSVQFFLDNGETASSAFVQGSYKVNFYNIPGAPINGVGGYAVVECASVLTPSSTYTWTRAVSVQRPRVGTTQTLNLGGG